mmetsp:Transcript_6218/g.17354  ORF Transcript_6218/g.17354 Transcript_6218/m.17354 type:complete len:383 (+) Transcript_6218:543-1691(+)
MSSTPRLVTVEDEQIPNMCFFSETRAGALDFSVHNLNLSRTVLEIEVPQGIDARQRPLALPSRQHLQRFLGFLAESAPEPWFHHRLVVRLCLLAGLVRLVVDEGSHVLEHLLHLCVASLELMSYFSMFHPHRAQRCRACEDIELHDVLFSAQSAVDEIVHVHDARPVVVHVFEDELDGFGCQFCLFEYLNNLIQELTILNQFLRSLADLFVLKLVLVLTWGNDVWGPDLDPQRLLQNLLCEDSLTKIRVHPVPQDAHLIEERQQLCQFVILGPRPHEAERRLAHHTNCKVHRAHPKDDEEDRDQERGAWVRIDSHLPYRTPLVEGHQGPRGKHGPWGRAPVPLKVRSLWRILADDDEHQDREDVDANQEEDGGPQHGLLGRQ